ncbi:unnamed protein product [Moneuplotes crassus]|uniref:Chloride channel protein n=1 Tax=Euplotes crassus TaxID=5936 RepID=A0AAD1YAA3_EUPCR|nr:unnamed protein product [Moneuplotes crassus]
MKPKRKLSHSYTVDDFFGMHDDRLTNDAKVQVKKLKQFSGKELKKSFNLFNPSEWIFLLLVGLSTAIICFAIDYAAFLVQALKSYLIEDVFQGEFILGYFVWILFALVFSTIAASAGYFNQHAEGSGIPELKSILAGVYIYKYLSFKTLLSKILGIFGALATGFSIGKEGPYVHLAACISNRMSKFHFFKKIGSDNILKRQMLAASVAAGVTATFVAPIGGVLFSIEVTTTYYLVNDMWKAFFCAGCTIIGLKFLSLIHSSVIFEPTNLILLDFDSQYIAYVILAVICGALGALFISLINNLIFSGQSSSSHFSQTDGCSVLQLLY